MKVGELPSVAHRPSGQLNKRNCFGLKDHVGKAFLICQGKMLSDTIHDCSLNQITNH